MWCCTVVLIFYCHLLYSLFWKVSKYCFQGCLSKLLVTRGKFPPCSCADVLDVLFISIFDQ